MVMVLNSEDTLSKLHASMLLKMKVIRTFVTLIGVVPTVLGEIELKSSKAKMGAQVIT